MGNLLADHPHLTHDVSMAADALEPYLRSQIGAQFSWSDEGTNGMPVRLIYDPDGKVVALVYKCKQYADHWHVVTAPLSKLAQDPDYDPDRRPGFMAQDHGVDLPPGMQASPVQTMLRLSDDSRAALLSYTFSRAMLERAMADNPEAEEVELCIAMPRLELVECIANLQRMLADMVE